MIGPRVTSFVVEYSFFLMECYILNLQGAFQVFKLFNKSTHRI